jgi:2-keto-4-pentenoate hydratase
VVWELSDAEQAARYLADRHVARESMDIMLQDFAPQNLGEAYTAQEGYLALLTETKGPIGGYKVGLTNPMMQKMLGVHEPCAGGVFASDIFQSPATVNDADYFQLAVECEVAFTMGADLPPRRPLSVVTLFPKPSNRLRHHLRSWNAVPTK